MLLLPPEGFVLILDVFLVLVNFSVKVRHHSFVHIPRLGDVFLMPLKGLLPRKVLGRVVVLNHAVVLLRHDIAAVVEGLHLACQSRHVSCKSVLSQIDVSLQLWIEHRAVRSHAATTLETAARSFVETGGRVVACSSADESLALRDEVVLEVGAHLARETLSVLVEHLPADEWEIVRLAVQLAVALSLPFHGVVHLLLAVKEEEVVLEHVVAALLRLRLDPVPLTHLLDVVMVLLQLQVSLLLLLDQVLPHLSQVVLQQLFVRHSVDADALAETNQFSLVSQRAAVENPSFVERAQRRVVCKVASTKESSLRRLRVRVRKVMVFVVSRSGATEVGDRRCDDGDTLRVSLANRRALGGSTTHDVN